MHVDLTQIIVSAFAFFGGYLTFRLSNKKTEQDYTKDQNDRLNRENERLSKMNDKLREELGRNDDNESK